MNPFLDVPVRSFGEIISRHAATRPDARAVSFKDRTWSYATLSRHSDRVAARLLREGCGPGERLAWLGRNTDLVPILAIAAARIGVTFVPLNWRLAPREIEGILADSRSRLLVISDGFDAPAEVPTLSEALLLSDEWLASGDGLPSMPIDPSATALMIYTSGTTGTPKGVMLSHRSLFGTSTMRRKAAVAWDEWGSDDVTLVPLPLGHIGGFGIMARALFFGSAVIIQPVFEPAEVLTAIAEHRVNKLALVPAAIKTLIEHPNARDIDYSRIKTMVYGAAPISVELLRHAMAVFGCQFAQSYGMTEVSGTCVALAPEDHDVSGTPRMSSAGRALPGTELRVIDAAGAVVPAGDLGEICIRSIAMMNGYWDKPEATAAVLDEDGWYRTGDVGVIDADGYVFIKDRLKDMIVSGAENIYPAEVENLMIEHPDVLEVAVIGVPDPRWGEAVKAIVVAVPGRTIDTERLIDWVKERLASFKVPKSVDFIDELPRNPTGKVKKEVLRQSYWAGRERQVN